jgi:hypothetical protein
MTRRFLIQQKQRIHLENKLLRLPNFGYKKLMLTLGRSKRMTLMYYETQNAANNQI